MSRRSRKTVKDFFGNLAVAFIVSTFSLPMLWRTGIGPAVTLWFVSGIAFGSCFFLLELVFKRIRLPSFLLQAVVHAALITLTIACAFLSVILVAMHFYGAREHSAVENLGYLLQYLGSRTLAAILAIAVLVAAAIDGLFAIRRKIGPTVFRSWVTGQYYKPRETELVIMFLDMKDSTVLAERLGNLRFSALVRDFFNDLTEPLEATGGEVSHYIGDEAVIYWRPRAVVQSLSLPARFAEELEHRREHYVREYGIVPAFKAGVHLGPVVATEVGQIKSEIVFHGDVLNTAARIQGLCNELGEQLLASVDVVHKAGHGIQLESLGLHRLKGKEEELELFRLSPAAQN